MQQSAMIKAIKHSLKDDFQQKTISHRPVLVRKINDYCEIKISNFNKIKGTVNITLTCKNKNNCDIINYIKLHIHLKDIEQTVNELIKLI